MISHHITFFDEKKTPIPLSAEEVAKIQKLDPMPQIIWIRGSAYNTSAISGIAKVSKPIPHKCPTCGEYKEPSEVCPKCYPTTPEQKEKNIKRMDEIRQQLFNWPHQEEKPNLIDGHCKACDVMIESDNYCADCAPNYL